MKCNLITLTRKRLATSYKCYSITILLFKVVQTSLYIVAQSIDNEEYVRRKCLLRVIHQQCQSLQKIRQWSNICIMQKFLYSIVPLRGRDMS